LNRLISYGFIFASIYLIILEGGSGDYNRLFIGLTLSIFIAYIGFIFNWITLDAILPVTTLGAILLGFAGWGPAVAIVLFFFSSSFLTSRNFNKSLGGSTDESSAKVNTHRRDGTQVWANGFWMACFALLWFLFETEAFLIAIFAVIATATADTWATEIGTNLPGKTKSILTLKPVEPGTDGGISVKGTAAAGVGSLLIALVSLYAATEYLFLTFITVLLTGFFGCIIDSYIGAIYQSSNKFSSKQDSLLKRTQYPKNSIVNWLSTGVGGLLAFLFYSIF